jgi:hypothetical protein
MELLININLFHNLNLLLFLIFIMMLDLFFDLFFLLLFSILENIVLLFLKNYISHHLLIL